MEEKILIKGDFGGKFIPLILYILAAVAFGVLTMIDLIDYWGGVLIIIGALSAIVLVTWGVILDAILKKREMIVTTKRVIVRGAFGYRTDLAVEKITDVSMCWLNGIGCASPSARVKYHFCKNKMELFDTIVAEVLQRDSKYL